jgi:hypothetical protein
MRTRNRSFYGVHGPLRKTVLAGETRLDERGQQSCSPRQHLIVEVVCGIVKLRVRGIATLTQPDVRTRDLLEHEREVLGRRRGRIGQQRASEQGATRFEYVGGALRIVYRRRVVANVLERPPLCQCFRPSHEARLRSCSGPQDRTCGQCRSASLLMAARCASCLPECG